MTFDPSLTNPTDRIRQRIGDTEVGKAQVQDETIKAYLEMGYTELTTARRLCLDLAAKWAGVGDVTLDDQAQKMSAISKRYIELAAAIAAEERPATPASAAAAGIIVGGLDDCRGPIDANLYYTSAAGIPRTGP